MDVGGSGIPVAPRQRASAAVRSSLVELLRPRPARRGRGQLDERPESSIGPMTDSPGEAARFLTRNAVDALPEGALERQLGSRTARCA